MRIDRRRKLHATVLLKALGYGPEDLLWLLLQARDDQDRAPQEAQQASGRSR